MFTLTRLLFLFFAILNLFFTLYYFSGSKWYANSLREIRSFESSFNNDGLDEYERTVEKNEMIRLTSIFGGTSDADAPFE